MCYSKSARSLLIMVIICFIVRITTAQEPDPAFQTTTISKTASQPTEQDSQKWHLSIIAGGASKHLTTKYEPANGYTEQHSNLGIEIGQAGPGWIVSAQATSFIDSHDEDSFLGIAALGYRQNLPSQFFIYGGIGAGYFDTSYYSGAIIMPFGELGWWRISAQGSYLPEASDKDSGIAVQFKFRVFEW